MVSKRSSIHGVHDDRLVMRRVGAARPALADRTLSAANPLPPISINPLDLNGTLTGGFTNWPRLLPSGPTLLTILKGSGLGSPLGKVDVSGSLTTSAAPTPTNSGPHGTLTLSNPRGSVTLRLSVPVGRVYSFRSVQFEFSIVKGTGVFAGGVGKGSADLGLIAQGGPVSWNRISQGSFTLSLHSCPPAS